jgi:hypothetical protein
MKMQRGEKEGGQHAHNLVLHVAPRLDLACHSPVSLGRHSAKRARKHISDNLFSYFFPPDNSHASILPPVASPNAVRPWGRRRRRSFGPRFRTRSSSAHQPAATSKARAQPQRECRGGRSGRWRTFQGCAPHLHFGRATCRVARAPFRRDVVLWSAAVPVRCSRRGDTRRSLLPPRCTVAGVARPRRIQHGRCRHGHAVRGRG